MLKHFQEEKERKKCRPVKGNVEISSSSVCIIRGNNLGCFLFFPHSLFPGGWVPPSLVAPPAGSIKEMYPSLE